MSFNFANFTKDLKNLGEKISTDFGLEIVPFAQRTTRLVQERMGNVSADEISQLPTEYLELAQRCNNLDKLYKNVLKVTLNYGNESYDYPTNLQELMNELSKNITDRAKNLSKATTPAEAQAAIVSDSAIKPPKTFYHALSRATDPAILEENVHSPQSTDDPFIKGIKSYSDTLKKIANARLGQDQLIVQKFNNPLLTTLRQSIQQSNAIQKRVEQKRIDYDLARVALSSCNNSTKEPALRVAMENAEDEFAVTVEDAINVMQNVLNNAKPLHELLELIKAQLAYHKLATELLDGMVTEVESLAEDGAASKDSKDNEFSI